MALCCFSAPWEITAYITCNSVKSKGVGGRGGQFRSCKPVSEFTMFKDCFKTVRSLTSGFLLTLGGAAKNKKKKKKRQHGKNCRVLPHNRLTKGNTQDIPLGGYALHFCGTGHRGGG